MECLLGQKQRNVVDDCKLYDNHWDGIFVFNCKSGITIKKNEIYDNDQSGVSANEVSNVFIMNNTILRNSNWGVRIDIRSQAVVKNNTINENHCGGICVDASFSNVEKVPTPQRESLFEYKIAYYFGPGIKDEGLQSKRRENVLQGNKDKRNQSTAKSDVILCYCCKKPEKKLEKCSKCHTARYCGKECEQKDWKNHKKICDRLLSDGSIVLNYVRKSMMNIYLSPNLRALPDGLTYTDGKRIQGRGPGLLPVGPKYCEPPNTTTWFIAKVMAGVKILEGKEYDPSVVPIYDRSLKIDGILTDTDHLYNLVWKHGAMGQSFNYWKKLFMWVKGPEDGKLRVFIKEFPPYQNW